MRRPQENSNRTAQDLPLSVMFKKSPRISATKRGAVKHHVLLPLLSPIESTTRKRGQYFSKMPSRWDLPEPFPPAIPRMRFCRSWLEVEILRVWQHHLFEELRPNLHRMPYVAHNSEKSHSKIIHLDD